MVRTAITSTANPRVKRLLALRDRRGREEEGVFTLEGYRAVRRAIDAGVQLQEIYICPAMFLGANDHALVTEAEARGAVVVELGAGAFAKCAYRDRPEGIIGVAATWSHGLDHLDAVLAGSPAAPLLLVVDAIEKPGNLGALLRSADGAGCHAVVVCDPVTDVFNPNIVRSSTGALFSTPVVHAPHAAALTTWLRSRSIAIVALTPEATEPYWAVDLTVPVAVVVGSEMHGLPAVWLDAADRRAVIPMAGAADSLNVATAGAIVVFDAQRQRWGSGGVG